MDLKCKGISWVGNMYQKFEAMFQEVDEIMSQQPAKYVENQLKTVGANVKQFYSDLMQDVLPPSSMDSVKAAASDLSLVKNTDFVTCKMSKVNIEEDLKMELGNLGHLPHFSSVDSVKEEHFDLSLEQIFGNGMYEKSKVGVKENPLKEKPCQSEMAEVVAHAENDPSMASLVCGFHHSNCDKERDSQEQMSHPIPVELTECKSCSKTGEIIGNNVDASTDTSSDLPSSNFVILVETCECKVSEVTPLGDVLSTESIKRSDGSIAEESGSSDITKLGMETIQPFDSVKLDESCIMVDSSELHSVSVGAGKHRSYKKKLQQAFATRMRLAKKQEYEQQAIQYKDLDAAASNLQNDKNITSSSALVINSKSPNNDFCETEWEII